MLPKPKKQGEKTVKITSRVSKRDLSLLRQRLAAKPSRFIRDLVKEKAMVISKKPHPILRCFGIGDAQREAF